MKRVIFAHDFSTLWENIRDEIVDPQDVSSP